MLLDVRNVVTESFIRLEPEEWFNLKLVRIDELKRLGIC